MALVVYLAPLNIITLCGWSQNTWAAPTMGARVGLLGSFGWASETSDRQAGPDFEFWVI